MPETKMIRKEMEVQTCCCCNQGKCEVEAMFEKNAYYPNELVRATVKFNNT